MTNTLVKNGNIRNIAIIAHVDHGKTTLVDAMFKQSGLFRDGAVLEDRIMDSGELEKERGITISAKNCEVNWNGVRINILDTPGHSDFGGEVERALAMVDGVVLLVDAAEGPLPQTRFVLNKALQNGLSLVLVINKIDRQDARCEEVLNEVYDLLIDLDASEEQLEFPVFYAIGRDGIAKKSLEDESTDLSPLMESIISHIPGPESDPKAPFQMMVADLGYSDYLGRLAIGKVHNGVVNSKDRLVRINRDGETKALKVSKIQVYKGTGLEEAETAAAGDIVILSGIDDIEIGDTVCTTENTEALPRLTVDEPTVSMRFTVNNTPMAGKEGKIVQSSRIEERLRKEALSNVSIRVEEAEDGDGYIVKGRGEFQMAILIETMRREGFELCVGRPHVIFKEEDGKRTEPIENLVINCGEEFAGVITETLSARKGQMVHYSPGGAGRIRLEFSVPSRALIGYRDQFLTDTKGTGIMSSYLAGYEPYRGDFPVRKTGSLVADRSGTAVPYALFNLEPRGRLYVVPGDAVYEGMIVGEHNRDNDLNVNACRTKQLTNIRAAGKDNSIILTPVTPLTPESALTKIKDDEMVEFTPKSIRLRKKILAATERKIREKRGTA